MARRRVPQGPELPFGPAVATAVTFDEPGGVMALPGFSSFSSEDETRALSVLSMRRPTGLSELPSCGEVEATATPVFGPLIGLDEAGRGPLAGPVVVAACAMPFPCPLEGIDDSKRLSEAERDALFEPISRLALASAVIVVEPAEIDSLNILRASLEGMARAWRALVKAHPELASARVLVDGRDRAPLPPEVLQHPLIKGDSRSLNIAAASILAKVTRDRLMEEAHLHWPQYGFDRHKGYPTVAHRRAIAEHGPCPIHRRSFTLGAP
jgi:ribonuclease HII